MSSKNHLQRILNNNHLRLQKLKEKQALYGVSADPQLLIEIDTISAEIEQLETELEAIDDEEEAFDEGAAPVMPQEDPRRGEPALGGNSGIIMSGGSIKADQIAVGPNARAVKNVNIVQDTEAQNSLDAAFIEWMDQIEARLAQLADFDDDEKEELIQKAAKIQEEAAKGEEANVSKLERLLNTIVAMAPDILDVTVTTLQNPLAGVGLVLKKINDRVKLEPK